MRLIGLVVVCAALLFSPLASAQNLGNKVLGAVGIDAGVQPTAGVRVIDQSFFYWASEVRDRSGERVPIRGLDLFAFANALGLLATFELGPLFYSAAAAAPYAHISLDSADPRASVDRYGFGDAYVRPLTLGMRFGHADIVASYGLYIPTGTFEPKSGRGVGRGHFTSQFSLGGASFLDRERRFRASALVSYDLNSKKRDIDITRGDTLQVQGGAGARLFQIVDVGAAGYALWQVRDDRGSDVPAVLRGARDRVVGVGPEVGVLLPPLRTKVDARFLWDVDARSRPKARVLVVTLGFLAWAPAAKD